MPSQLEAALATDNPNYPAASLVRILVVDDFEPCRRYVCSRLDVYKKYQIVGQAMDGVGAIQNAQRLSPDLIVLDVGLPTLSGIQAASRIHEVVPAAKILFVTQNNDMDVVRAALSNGAHGYVLKESAGRDLLPAIEAVLRGERFVSERLNR